MNVRWFRVHEGSRLQDSGAEAAIAAWKRNEGTFWADVESYGPSELGPWLGQIGASEAARECCLTAGETSRVVPLEDAVFFEFPVHQGGADSELEELGFLCMDRIVVTLHRKKVSALDSIAGKLRADGPTRYGTVVSGLVPTILLALSTQSIRIAGSLKQSIYALDERMGRRPDEVDADEIAGRKRSLRQLEAVVDEQPAIFGMIGVIGARFVDPKGLAELVEIVSRNTSFATRAVDRMEKHLYDLQQRFDSNRQEATNQHLAILTVISAIFLPLSLLAGIWGMNFEVMPELHFPYGYPLALGVMGVVASGLYWYFRSKGWLD